MPGPRGTFHVFVGDTLVADRKGGLIAKFTKRPWPDVEEVVAKARAALAGEPGEAASSAPGVDRSRPL